jgi:hypothetical protein
MYKRLIFQRRVGFRQMFFTTTKKKYGEDNKSGA